MGAASSPGAQTATAIDISRLEDEPLFSVSDILRQSPGVSVKQGNGPRDLGISIRGSNARNGFGIRNIVIFDDGFPVTQPDGLSRSDLIDPHAYIGVDVWRGPSSALFGNYATGGALNFRTWPGGKIDGISYGLDGGSFNYWNNYLQAGTKTQRFEGGLFLSDVRGDGYFGYSAFDTQTANLLLSYKLTRRDTITLKGINNELYTELPFRMSLDQFKENPFQKGCATAVNAALGCATNNFSATNTAPFCRRPPSRTAPTGTTGAPSAAYAGSMNSTPTRRAASSTSSTIATSTSLPARLVRSAIFSPQVIADLTHATILPASPPSISSAATGTRSRSTARPTTSLREGMPRLGKLQSTTQGSTTNLGARARQELALPRNVIMTAGIDVEKSWIDGFSTASPMTWRE